MAAWENSDHDDDDEVAPIRVLVANLYGLVLQLLLDLIRQQTDMVLTGQVEGTLEVLEAAGHDVDVLILGVEQVQPLPGICSHLLSEYPSLRILVIENSGEEAALYWLGLRRRQFHRLSGTALLEKIRNAHRLNPAI